MRSVVWLVLLFAIAVVAATTLGANDGLAGFYWGGWRIELSLNLFVLLFLLACVVTVLAIQGVDALVGLPRRAREWRAQRRDRSAQAALREALAQYFGGRYSRAQKAALRALAIQADTPELDQDHEFAVLGHLLVAGSAHRLQDRMVREHQLQRAFERARGSAAARQSEEGARLLAAEWALDDRDATRALELLGSLPLGVARRTQALRLRLQASRLNEQPQEALKTARLLAKHQAFSSAAAQGLLRSLAFETLAIARDPDQLRAAWQQFDPTERRDPIVAARAATRAAAMGATDDARAWLSPLWDGIGDLAEDERVAVAEALASAAAGVGADWLPRLEAAERAHPRDGAVALAVGVCYAERQIWGKSRALLEQAAADASLGRPARRRAWLALATMAQAHGDEREAARCFESGARLG